ATGGEVPGHPAYPGHRVVVPGDLQPAGQRPAERLLDDVPGVPPVAEVRVQLHRQIAEVRRVQLLERIGTRGRTRCIGGWRVRVGRITGLRGRALARITCAGQGAGC